MLVITAESHLWTVPHMLYRIPGKHRKPRILVRKTRKTTENTENYGKPRIPVQKTRKTTENYGKHSKLRKTQNTCTKILAYYNSA